MKGVVCAIAIIAFSPGCGNFDYDGDGQFSDRGVLSQRPRYTIVFDQLPLGESAERILRVRRSPEATFQLQLHVEQNAEPLPFEDFLELAQRKDLVISASVSSRGRSIASMAGPARAWNRGSVGESWFFQDQGLSRIEIGNDSSFDLVLGVESVGGLPNDIDLRPVLVGGGYEWW